MALMVPAFTSIKGTNDITKATDDIAGALATARAYAMANNTYTWVGFYEEDANTWVPTNVKPPYTGKGQIVMAVVASKDGTTSPQNGTTNSLDPTLITPIAKIIKVENAHLTDIGAPAAGGDGKTLDTRPDLPYTNPGSPLDHFNRISSDSSDTTQYPFVVGSYTFYKTVRFTPRGEANINSTYTAKRIAEIGVKPTRGNAVDNNSRDIAAIQLTGIGGKVNVYRR